METIICAAYTFGDKGIAVVESPGRHADIIRALISVGHKRPVRMENGGFLTSTGRFVTRSEALTVALNAEQVQTIKGYQLTTEDLW